MKRWRFPGLARLSAAPGFALALLFAANLLNFFDRQLLGALGEPIRKEFELDDTTLGLLGTAFILVYAAVGLPLGRLADRWIRVRLLSIGVTVWSLLTALTGFAWNSASLFAARIGVGIGEAVCAPASQSMIGDLYPPARRARAMAIFMLGLPLGTTCAFFLAGVIGQSLGWRATFIIACVPGLVLALLLLLLREPTRGAADFVPAADAAPRVASSMEALGKLVRIRTLWWIIASGALHNFNMYAVSVFQTPFLQRYHGLGLRDANLVSAVVLGAVGIVGLLAGGWAADRLNSRRSDGRLLLSAATMALAAPCIYFALALPPGSIRQFLVLMGSGITLLFVYYATVYAAIQDVVEPRLRGTAIALYFFAMYLLGASLGPVATGMLSDHFARRAMIEAGASEMTEAFRAVGLHEAMYVIPVLAMAAALVLFAASRTIGREILARPDTGAAANPAGRSGAAIQGAER